ncbi:MAG: polysaccharide deacetylase family protein [Victivallaceae bacterium]|nr:polysaccharide deacetylase family protein [Victivallaceae bacterium]
MKSEKGKDQVKTLDLDAVKHGVVCFTFDDGRYEEWLSQQELFAGFGAHATFFYMNTLDAPALDSMRELSQRGHSIGLHSVTHRSAVEGFSQEGGDAYIAAEITPHLSAVHKVGIEVRSFAYPNNYHSDETDRKLSELFRHFRAGLPKPHAKGYWIAEQDDAYIDLDRIAGTPTLGGCGIGEYYLSTEANLDAALERAAGENKLIVFFSHGITDQPRPIDVSVEMLRHCLATAARLGMKIAGFDELP